MAVDLARAGLGVALAQRMLAAPDLDRGDLVCLSQIALPLGHPYALVSPPAKAAKREVIALRRWLGEAGSDPVGGVTGMSGEVVDQ